MRLFLSLVLLLGLSTSAHAGENLQAIEGDKVIGGASRLEEIHQEMETVLGLGKLDHSMAAAVLARCMGTHKLGDQVSDFKEVFNELANSRWQVIRNGIANKLPQLSYAAATLTCRNDGRDKEELRQLLDSVYQAITLDGWKDWEPNVVVAAELVK